MAILALGGDYVAAASGRSGGGGVYVSADGQTWELTGESMEGMGGLFLMGDRLLTDGWQGSQRVTLVSDDAGRTWDEVGHARPGRLVDRRRRAGRDPGHRHRRRDRLGSQPPHPASSNGTATP